ncbi:hypothetical protein R3W88_032260 [Solanum pinnatisectum]|uniref:Myb/SANT-like domain-containing protein n=1 Tax=Solanum pinnatisectum TaxID=50273 RepID=A0AAV9LNW9_9SOLN|nr:hypothetical protein R3W88_032260 [Solanum pinnatisectum]
MSIIPEADVEISDDNSVTSPFLIIRYYTSFGKRKRMNKPRGSAVDKWTYEETSILINVLHDDARKFGVENNDKFDDEKINTKIQRLKTDTKTFKDLLNTCSGYYGLKDYDTLDEIFGNSFAIADNVKYIKNPNFSSKSNDVIFEENEPF